MTRLGASGRSASARRAGWLVLALTAMALPFAMRVSVDNRMELWVEPSGTIAEDYACFRDRFGSDEFVLVSVSGPDLLSVRSIAAQLETLERLEALPGVVRVASAASVYRDLLGEGDPEWLRRELLETPFYESFLVADGGTVLGLFLETSIPETPSARRELLRGVRAALAPLEARGLEVHAVGPPVLNAALDELSRREAVRTFPFALGLGILVLLAAFRAWQPALVAAACAGLAIVLTLGLMGAAGRPLNMISSVLPSLLWVLALSGIVHLLRRAQDHRARGASAPKALEAALSEMALPCALSAVTTALGFLSLGAADMRPVRELGVFAAAGLIASLAVNLGAGPLLAAGLGLPPRRSRRPEGSFSRCVARAATARPVAVLAVSIALIGAAAPALGRLRVESDPLTFLPSDSPVRSAYRAVSERLTGFYSLEVIVDTPTGWLDPSTWPSLDALARALEGEPGVARVLSPLDFLRKLHHWEHGRRAGEYALPRSADDARRLVEDYDPFGGGTRTGLVAEGGTSVRLSALVRVMASDDFLAIVRTAEGALAALPPPLSGFATGIVLQLVDAQLALVESQLRSFAWAFATVFGGLWLGLRSLRLLAVAVPPNLLPIGAAFTAMALGGIRLDAATVMMASMALGIAVDDTVHLLVAWRRERSAGSDPSAAAVEAMGRVGPAMAITTAAACAGFGALAFSAFVPIRLFGLLSALAMVAAIAADALLVPALLALGGRRS